jgi:hypothetical protein
MLPDQAQPRQETVTADGWSALPPELLVKVLEALQAAERSDAPQAEGLGFSKAVAVVRPVCAGWQAVHDAAVRRLVFERHFMTDDAVGMLVRRFPAVASVQFTWVLYPGHYLTDAGVGTVCGLRALTALDLGYCREVTDVGVRAASSLRALTVLGLRCCHKITDAGVRAASSLPALTCLDLDSCHQITDDGVRALGGARGLTSLSLSCCLQVTKDGVRALSSLPALTQLDVSYCSKVTAAGVQALRNATAAPSLRILPYDP